jgi:ankyrin repeat protein
VEMLLSNGDPGLSSKASETSPDGYDPWCAHWSHISLLHKAADAGDHVGVSKLMQKKFDVNTIDNDGFTALYVAARKGHYKIAEVLLQNRAKI